jgi:hypothetical protein
MLLALNASPISTGAIGFRAGGSRWSYFSISRISDHEFNALGLSLFRLQIVQLRPTPMFDSQT